MSFILSQEVYRTEKGQAEQPPEKIFQDIEEWRKIRTNIFQVATKKSFSSSCADIVTENQTARTRHYLTCKEEGFQKQEVLVTSKGNKGAIFLYLIEVK